MRNELSEVYNCGRDGIAGGTSDGHLEFWACVEHRAGEGSLESEREGVFHRRLGQIVDRIGLGSLRDELRSRVPRGAIGLDDFMLEDGAVRDGF